MKLLILGLAIFILNLEAYAQDETNLIEMSFEYGGSPITIFTKMGEPASFSVNDEFTAYSILLTPSMDTSNNIAISIDTAKKAEYTLEDSKTTAPNFQTVDLLERAIAIDNQVTTSVLGVMSVNIVSVHEARARANIQ